ncbi:hypothetical protein PoB_006729100 [Plakobranchus ocellatus]|uniref:Uncharacterized protein n=1 Tax=Plakobranchus ocellatus TaxID=259542 RepID=A0AAV4DA30_9GAST|nr:hypothetical protein PoB_006729100 [Plakobranchus ocellatus]
MSNLFDSVGRRIKTLSPTQKLPRIANGHNSASASSGSSVAPHEQSAGCRRADAKEEMIDVSISLPRYGERMSSCLHQVIARRVVGCHHLLVDPQQAPYFSHKVGHDLRPFILNTSS